MRKKANTIHWLKPEDCVQRRVSEEEEVYPVAVGSNGLYELNAVVRFNDRIQSHEKFYEIFNRKTEVVEARMHSNLLSALVSMHSVDKALKSLEDGDIDLDSFYTFGGREVPDTGQDEPQVH